MALSELKRNTGIIKKLNFIESKKRRFLDLGFTIGTCIELINKGNDPLIVKIKDSRIAIRLEDAKYIEII